MPGLGGSGLGGWCVRSGGWGCAWSGGVCQVQGRVSGPGGGGVSGLGGCLVWGGGVPGLGGVCLSALWDTTTPLNRMTNRCKNITLATTSLRPVIR